MSEEKGGAGVNHGHGDGGHHPPSSVGPAATKLILRIFFAVCAILVVADFIAHRHVEHPLENVPTFYALYGFIGVAGLIVAAKTLRKIVMRDEDYYDAE